MVTAKKPGPGTPPKQRARSAPAKGAGVPGHAKTALKPEAAQKTGKTGAPKSAKVLLTTPTLVPKAVASAKKQRTDWDAVERDYRTGKFTLRELGAKHGADNGLISRKAKKDGWTQDLSLAIKQATNAKLIEELVSKEVSNGQQKVSNTVLAAADLNKQVILSHRNDILRARDLTNFLLQELEQITIAPSKVNKLVEVLAAGEEFTSSETLEARQAVTELMKLPNRILSAQRIAQVMARLQPLERKAFGLDDDVAPAAVDAFDELSDEELDRRINEGYERHRPR
jgi:hypothetical protein